MVQDLAKPTVIARPVAQLAYTGKSRSPKTLFTKIHLFHDPRDPTDPHDPQTHEHDLGAQIDPCVT